MGWFRRRRVEPAPGNITAVILAGGRSERFGRDKGLADLQGRPLVRWAAGLAAATAAKTILVLAPGMEDEAWRQAVGKAGPGGGLQIVRDPVPHKGPVAGVRAALAHIETPNVLLLAVDMPLLRPDIVLGLMDRLVGHDAVAYHLEGWWRPMPSLWKRDALELAVTRAEHQGTSSLRGLLDMVDARPLGPEFLALFATDASILGSVNTEADLAAVAARLA